MKQIDRLKAEKYKQSRLKGNSIAKSMINAGSKETTAYHDAKGSRLVITCERELMDEVKSSDISVDWVIGKLNTELQSIHAKSSDRVRILELLGKYLNMFRDNQTTNVGIFGLSSKDISDLPDVKPIDTTT